MKRMHMYPLQSLQLTIVSKFSNEWKKISILVILLVFCNVECVHYGWKGDVELTKPK